VRYVGYPPQRFGHRLQRGSGITPGERLKLRPPVEIGIGGTRENGVSFVQGGHDLILVAASNLADQSEVSVLATFGAGELRV